jgi:hypothetical protein
VWRPGDNARSASSREEHRSVGKHGNTPVRTLRRVHGPDLPRNLGIGKLSCVLQLLTTPPRFDAKRLEQQQGCKLSWLNKPKGGCSLRERGGLCCPMPAMLWALRCIGYLSFAKSKAGALASCSFVRSVMNLASGPTLICFTGTATSLSPIPRNPPTERITAVSVA